MSFIYSFVSTVHENGGTVLADYTSYSGNFSTVAIQCLSNCPKGEAKAPTKATFNADQYTFNYLVDEKYVYMVVADVKLGRTLPYEFLDIVRKDFREKYDGKIPEQPSAHSLDKSYEAELKKHMEHVVNNQEDYNKISLVQHKVGDVVSVMNENVYKVLNRGEKIGDLVKKTEDMQNQANKFNKAGTALRDKMWWANFRSKLFFYGVIAIVVLVVFFWLCGDCLVPSDSGSTTTGATTGNSTEQAASVGSSWVIFDTNMG